MNSTISSKTISTITQIPHGRLMRHIADMVTAGTIDKSRLKTWGERIRYEATTHLDLKDVVALAAHLKPKRRVIDALVDAFDIGAVAKSKPDTAVLETLPRGEKAQLRSMFSRQADIAAAVLDDDAQAMEKAGLIRRGAVFWIGTSTPRMVAMSDEEGLVPGQLSRMLRRQTGVLALGAKRFDGHTSKALQVPESLVLHLVTADEV